MTAAAPAPVLIGRRAALHHLGPDKVRHVISCELRHVDADAATIDHGHAGPDAVALSFTGEVLRARGRSWSADRYRDSDYLEGGQTVDTLRAALEAGDIVTAPEEIVPALPELNPAEVGEVVALWDRWHLSDMRAPCAHQSERWTCTADRNTAARAAVRTMTAHPRTASVVRYALERAGYSDAPWLADLVARVDAGDGDLAALGARLADGIPPTEPCGTPNGWPLLAELGEGYPKRGDQCRVCGRNRWDEPTDWCPVTGYRFGTRWLVEPVTPAALARARAIFGVTPA